jgi:hypothetical protein
MAGIGTPVDGIPDRSRRDWLLTGGKVHVRDANAELPAIYEPDNEATCEQKIALAAPLNHDAVRLCRIGHQLPRNIVAPGAIGIGPLAF